MLAAAKASSPVGQQAWREPGDKAAQAPQRSAHGTEWDPMGPATRPPTVSTLESLGQQGCCSYFVLSTKAQWPGLGFNRWPGSAVARATASRERAAGSERAMGLRRRGGL